MLTQEKKTINYPRKKYSHPFSTHNARAHRAAEIRIIEPNPAKRKYKPYQNWIAECGIYKEREREFFQFDVNSFMVTLKSANVHPNSINWREHIRFGHENTATLDRPENIKIVEAVNNGLVFGANNRHKNMNHRFELCILTNWNDSSLISISREGCANVYYNICAHIKTNQAIVF